MVKKVIESLRTKANCPTKPQKVAGLRIHQDLAEVFPAPMAYARLVTRTSRMQKYLFREKKIICAKDNYFDESKEGFSVGSTENLCLDEQAIILPKHQRIAYLPGKKNGSKLHLK